MPNWKTKHGQPCKITCNCNMTYQYTEPIFKQSTKHGCSYWKRNETSYGVIMQGSRPWWASKPKLRLILHRTKLEVVAETEAEIRPLEIQNTDLKMVVEDQQRIIDEQRSR